MLFLIEYDRGNGVIVTFRAFTEAERRKAEDARLQLELNLSRRGTAREVVLLEAASEAALRRSHRRYFEDLTAIVDSRVD